MDERLIEKKFGNKYLANKDSYHMGIHHSLGEAIAKRFGGQKICLDSCSGAGFMALMLAKYVDMVISLDVNQEHIQQAKENSKIAGVEHKIRFIDEDVINAIESLDFEAAFLDPDWAKPGDEKGNHVSELSEMNPPADILLAKVFKKTQNVCLRLPKSFNLEKLSNLPLHEVEAVYLENELKFYCIYFGCLMKIEGNSELRV